MYIKEGFWGNKTYYVSGAIAGYYNGSDNCRIINNGDPLCGAAGIFGFPNGDPLLQNDTITLRQEFEEAVIEYNQNTQNFVILAQTKESRRFQNKEFGRNMVQQVWAGELTDVEAFAQIADYIASKREITTEGFVKDMTVLFTGAETMLRYATNAKFKINSPFDIQGFSDLGFKFIYSDSHYCIDPKHECLSNQLFHSMLGFNVSYFHGKEKADKETLNHDKNHSPLGVKGSYEDIWLGEQVAYLGQRLRDGQVSKENVGQWILDYLAVNPHIAEPQYNYLRMPQDEIVELGKYKKKFRIFEYEQNGNIYGRWDYSKDMLSAQCKNGKYIYYQDYEYFYFENVRISVPRVVWSDEAGRIVFLSGNNLQKYSTGDSICSNLTYLAQNFGRDLHIGFSKQDGDKTDDYFSKFLIEDYLDKGLDKKPMF